MLQIGALPENCSIIAYYTSFFIIFHYFYDLYGVPIAIVSKNKEIQKKITENEENCAADPDLARTCKSALSDNLTVFPFWLVLLFLCSLWSC